MRVLHSYCLNYNIGDYALGFGVKNLLRHHLQIDYIGNTNLQGREFNEYYIKEVVNKKYDLLVIGGGGIIHGKHWPNGWFWLIDKDLIKEIAVPFIVYGAGYNYWEEEGGIPERGIEHLAETRKHALSFTVRNDGSAARILKDTGLQFDVVPDPGFHINLDTVYPEPQGSEFVIIQLANDKADIRLGDTADQMAFVLKMKEVVRELSEKYRVVFAPHVYHDIEISRQIADGIPNTEIWDFGYFAFDHCDKAMGYYQNAKFVISMRGHGQIVPIAFNTPVISLSNHPKHVGLMKELGLADYNVDLESPDFDVALRSRIKQVELNHSVIVKQYSTINEGLSTQSNNAWNHLKSLLG